MVVAARRALTPDNSLTVPTRNRLATAWARVYAGAHFPSDVLLGLGLGGTLGWAGARLFGLA